MPPKDSAEYNEIWKAIDKLTDSITQTVIPAITEIKTLLVGIPGSNTGVCNQIKTLQDGKADRELITNHFDYHEKKDKNFYWTVGLFVSIGGIIIPISVTILLKILKII